MRTHIVNYIACLVMSRLPLEFGCAKVFHIYDGAKLNVVFDNPTIALVWRQTVMDA